MKHLKLGMLLFALLCFSVPLSLAQDEGEDVDYAYGVIKSISANQMVVTEYDYDTDAEVDVTYALDPAVKLENVNSLKEIENGDMVDLDYVVKDNKKIATLLIIEKQGAEEEVVEYTEVEEDITY